MTEQSLIEKIKKLLALSSSPNENEAALALQMAKNLMKQYNITLADDNPIIEATYNSPFKSVGLNDVLPNIACIVAGIFDGYALTSNSEDVRLFSYKSNCEVIKHGIDCILNQLYADFKIAYAKQKSISFSYGFWKGALKGLNSRYAKEMSISTDITHKLNLQYPNLGYYENTVDSETGQDIGLESGKNAQLRRGVSNSSFGGFLE